MAGKVSGAGGGGFMMFIVPPEQRLDVVEALNNAGARASPVKFVHKGCETWRMKR
jgi:D-glycero-alpha-D-manno-heptose-7-phosphate kinase